MAQAELQMRHSANDACIIARVESTVKSCALVADPERDRACL